MGFQRLPMSKECKLKAFLYANTSLCLGVFFFFFLLIFLKAKAQWDISYFNLHMNTQNSLSTYSYSRVLVAPVSI